MTTPVVDALSFFFSSRRRHTRSLCDWSSDVCSSDLRSQSPASLARPGGRPLHLRRRTQSRLLARSGKNGGSFPSGSAPFLFRPSYLSFRSEERRVGKEFSFAWAAFPLCDSV